MPGTFTELSHWMLTIALWHNVLFASYCCHNKLPQVSDFKQLSCMISEGGGQNSEMCPMGLNSRGLHACFLLKAVGENPAPWLFMSSSGLSFSLAYGPYHKDPSKDTYLQRISFQSLPPSSPTLLLVSHSPCIPLLKNLVIILGLCDCIGPVEYSWITSSSWNS